MATAGSCDADDFPVCGEVYPAEKKQRERELSEKILAYLCTAAAGALWIVGVFLGAYALFVGMVAGYPGQALALAGVAMLIVLAAALVTDISTELREDVRWDEQLRQLREESVRESLYRALVEED
jgi:hypothetical protein